MITDSSSDVKPNTIQVQSANLSRTTFTAAFTAVGMVSADIAVIGMKLYPAGASAFSGTDMVHSCICQI